MILAAESPPLFLLEFFIFELLAARITRFRLSKNCPQIDLLRAFNEGRISNAFEIEQISEHLRLCDSCIRQLDAMEPSSLAKGLRTAQADETDGNPDDLATAEGFSTAMSKINSQLLLGSSKQKEFGEDRYQVLSIIGEGNFGDSFLARLDSDDLFNIKIPFATKLTTSMHNEQFLADCHAAQSLEHPNISTPVDFGEWDANRVYYSTDFIGNYPNLKQIAKTAVSDDTYQFNPKEMVTLFNQLLDTVSHAHSKRILHRHLNPNNIWITNDRSSIIVGDFGFKLDSRYHFELLEPLAPGDPFLSPESRNNDAHYIDVRSDIYAIGRILKLLIRITKDINDELARGINQVITHSTRQRRSERYQTIDLMIDGWSKAIQMA